MGNANKTVFVVEDNPKVARDIRLALREDGFNVEVFLSGRSLLHELEREAADLVLLDLGLPDIDGMEVLQKLRAKGSPTPVIILTARDAVDDRVLGLDSGANDYLVKPFALPELLARIRRVLRDRRTTATTLSCGDLTFDPVRLIGRRGTDEIPLTPRECRLLQYFLENKDRIVSRTMLAEDVWDAPGRFTPLDNVIEVAVSRLRDKIDKPYADPMLHTIRGVGYLLKEPER